MNPKKMVMSFTKIGNPRKTTVCRLSKNGLGLSYRLQCNFQTGVSGRKEARVRKKALEIVSIKLILAVIGLCVISPVDEDRAKKAKNRILEKHLYFGELGNWIQ